MNNIRKIIGYFDMDGPLADFEMGIGRDLSHPKRGIYENNKELVKPMYERGFFRNLPVTEGAKEAVEYLMNLERVDWYVATKPMVDTVYYSATEKFEWLNEHFPSLVEKTFMTCCKGHLNGHYLIDDYAERWEPIFGGSYIYFDVAKPYESWNNIVNYFEKYDPNNLPNRVMKRPEEVKKYPTLWRPVGVVPTMGHLARKQMQLQILVADNLLKLVTLELEGEECWVVHSQDMMNGAIKTEFQRDAENSKANEWKLVDFIGDPNKLNKSERYNIRDLVTMGAR